MAQARDPLALKASEVRPGMEVIYRGNTWGVWSPAPESGSFWLTRWIEVHGERKNQTAKAKVTELARVNNRAPGGHGPERRSATARRMEGER